MKAALIVFALALLALLGWSLVEGKNSQQQIQALEDSLAAKQRRVDSLSNRIVKADTEYVVQKVVDRQAVGDYRKLRDSLQRNQQETPEAPADVALLQATLTACDAALAADSLVISLCEARISQRDTALAWKDSIISGKDALIGLIRNADTCHYLVLRGPCPVIGVGIAGTTGAGGTSLGLSVGLMFPVKRLKF